MSNDWITQIQTAEGFDWDTGNDKKNVLKHAVSCLEAEQVFAHQPLLLNLDLKHSQRESRYRALGKTAEGRYLHVSFTLRGRLIRIISVRDMSKRERKSYEQN
jgi:uncharacterized protein